MAGKPTVVMIRHGSTELNNQKGTMRGWLNVPLTSEGHKEAQKVAMEVAQNFQLKRIFASDLLRVKESAEYLSKATGVPVGYTPNLRPWNGGVLVGKVIPDLDKQLQYYIEHLNEAPKGGESMNDFLSRLLGFMAKVFDHVEMGESPVACYTSVRPIEATLGWVEGGMTGKIDPTRLEAKKETVKPGGFTTIVKGPKEWKEEIFAPNHGPGGGAEE